MFIYITDKQKTNFVTVALCKFIDESIPKSNI